MTGLDHETSESVSVAARWVAETPHEQRPRPLVWHLRETFGLTVSEACQAIGEASRLHVEGGRPNAKP